LVEVADAYGAGQSHLINDITNIDWVWFDGVQTLDLSSGASAPEHLVEGVIAALKDRFDITVETIETAREDIIFRLPRQLEGVD
jgi:4-hydroxy-3-methylbut-2-enyl diphosphate reductase